MKLPAGKKLQGDKNMTTPKKKGHHQVAGIA